MPLLSTRGAGSARGFGFGGGKKPLQVDYLVVAGGGGGSNFAGGGAGGHRSSFPGGTKIEILPNDPMEDIMRSGKSFFV